MRGRVQQVERIYFTCFAAESVCLFWIIASFSTVLPNRSEISSVQREILSGLVH